MKQSLVLLAHQRSGTTVLRRMLDTDPNIRQLGEVFSSRHALGVHKTLLKCAEEPGFSFRLADMNHVFDTMLLSLHEKYGEDVLVIDAKYNSMGPFNGYGWHINREPQFIDYCKTNDIPIIHLIRKDMFGVLASERLAVRSKVWHLEKGQERAMDAKFFVGLKPFKRDYHRLLIEATRFHDAVSRYEKSATIFFEDTLVDNMFQPGPLTEIERILGRPLRVERSARLSKVSPPPQDFISNYEELHQHVMEDRGLGRMRDNLLQKIAAHNTAADQVI